jgi:hypothetical protein
LGKGFVLAMSADGRTKPGAVEHIRPMLAF